VSHRAKANIRDVDAFVENMDTEALVVAKIEGDKGGVLLTRVGATID
jgi:hypothetical protein